MTTASPVKGLHTILTPTPFPVGPANVYLYEGDGLYLIDTGTNTPEAWDAFLKGLHGLGFSPTDISAIFLTHHHLDHIGLSRKIRDLSGAKIYAHPAVRKKIALFFNEALTRANLAKVLVELGVPKELNNRLCDERHNFGEYVDDFAVDEDFEDEKCFGPFRTCFRPGHSTTDTVLFHEEEQWAFTGDHLIHRITSNPLLRKHDEEGRRDKSLIEYCDSLQKTKALPITWCFAGHNRAFTDHEKSIDRVLFHLERRNEKILSLFNGSAVTPFEMTQSLFPHLSDEYMYYCLSAATGHLELLEEQGLVGHEMKSGVLRYFMTEAG